MKFIIAMAFLSLTSFVQANVEDNYKAEICAFGLQKTNSFLSTQDCVEKSTFEYNCFTDRCIHGMNRGDISFSLYVGDTLLRGEVEVNKSYELEQDTFYLYQN